MAGIRRRALQRGRGTLLTLLILGGLTAASFAVGAPPARAGTLDQSQTSASSGSGVYGAFRLAQTFTAGRSGQLDQIDVSLMRTCAGNGVTVEIRTVAADGTPTNTVLASGSIPDASVSDFSFGFVAVTLTSPVSVSAGTKYAIVIAAPTSSACPSAPYFWGQADADPYPQGQRLSSIDGGANWAPQAGYDHAFKTYVIDPPTSEPPPSDPPPSDPPPSDPPPADQPPAGSSQFTRTLRISFSEKRDAFRGRIVSASPACVVDQKVKVFEKEKGKDPIVGRDLTNEKGKYSLEEKRPEGKFYAKVAQSGTSGGTCLAAQSKAIKVG